MNEHFPNTEILYVNKQNLRFELDLARRFDDELGFLPLPSLEKYCDLGGVLRATENGQPCGFLAGTHSAPRNPPTARIYQAAIDYQSQRRQHGLALVRKFQLDATNCRALWLACWCRSELQANLFWKAAGFIEVGRTTAGTKRGGFLIGWVKPLITRATPFTPGELFAAVGLRNKRRTNPADRPQQPVLFDM